MAGAATAGAADDTAGAAPRPSVMPLGCASARAWAGDEGRTADAEGADTGVESCHDHPPTGAP